MYKDSSGSLYDIHIKSDGKDAIVELWVNAMAGFPFVAQLIQNGTTEINGDTATGRWYIVEHIQTTEKDSDGNPVGFF